MTLEIKSIQEIATLPIIVVLYRAGTSGEFFSHAITQSFDSITKTDQFWQNNNRCKYLDLFNRNLNSGFETIDHNEIIRGIGIYFDRNNPTDTTHIVMAHPDASSMIFLQEHLSFAHFIEITANNFKSKKFMAIAAKTKIAQTSDKININFSRLPPGQVEKKFPKHLCIEWEDFVLNDTESVFYSVSEFIQKPGNIDTFCSCVADYKQRNLDLLNTLND